MGYLLIISATVLAWTAMHMVACERERRMREISDAKVAADAKKEQQRALSEQPIVVS